MDILATYHWLLQNHIVFYVAVLFVWRWLLTTICTMYQARQKRFMQESDNRFKLEQLRLEEKRLDIQHACEKGGKRRDSCL
ncbi:MAG: hypothetical protein H0U76_18530 [Ktedonobacteraceae bacterium]|nr:hypothetical protein [Ktedonobacteraceae bacterium]